MLEKFVEGHNVSYIVPMDRVVDQHQLYMDVTGIIVNAIAKDTKKGYKPHGPNFGIEHNRVTEYVDYVKQYVTRDNFSKFDTKDYSFFLGSTHNKGE